MDPFMNILLVSNRVSEPSGGAMQGGLAAALFSAMESSRVTWIGSSGKFTAQASGELPITIKPIGASRLATVDFPAMDYRRFYNGMSNAALWPVLHYRADLLRYESDAYASYLAINEAMAEAVCRVLEPDSLIWVHDYHFFPLGDRLRRRGIDGPIGFFLHTPFPTRSVLACLPGHRELMRTLAAYDVIGFQTSEDMIRFRDYATNDLAATMIAQTDLRFGERRVKLGVFPIGIDVDRFAAAAARNGRSRVLARIKHSLDGGKQVIGVDRLDYSKGLPLRFQAYERFLTRYPEERKRVSFLQITPPTRSEVESYKKIRTELASTAGEINARFGDVGWMALNYINESFPPDRLAGFYRISKIGCVTPLRDGMNLVAKEYIASQESNDPGVLVLSKFAGAAKELNAAILVNPYNTEEVAAGLYRALYMPQAERVERWNTLMRILRGGNLQNWYESFLVALRTTSMTRAPFIDRSVA
jgi:trehalose 6-phosphate synthase